MSEATKLEFHGSRITSGVGVLAYRGHDHALGLETLNTDYIQMSFGPVGKGLLCGYQ